VDGGVPEGFPVDGGSDSDFNLSLFRSRRSALDGVRPSLRRCGYRVSFRNFSHPFLIGIASPWPRSDRRPWEATSVEILSVEANEHEEVESCRDDQE